MCNPRKVMIHLSRAIEEAWRTTVEEAAGAEGEVRELARLNIDIPLDAEMGDLALQMLERIMAGEFEGFEPWDRDTQGNFRRELGDVVLVYHPGSRQLAVEAALTEAIDVEVRATAEAHGFSVGEVAVEAMAGYYDDGWGGRTEERAREQAQADAEQKLAAATEALHREQNAEALAEARVRAQQQAAAELERRRDEVRPGPTRAPATHPGRSS